MRITELLEHIEDRNKNGIEDQLEFDLGEDLLFYMHNDDDIYRRHTYPAILNCKQRLKNGLKMRPEAFIDAVKTSYKKYCEEYPLRELPDTLPSDILRKLCTTMCSDIKNKD